MTVPPFLSSKAEQPETRIKEGSIKLLAPAIIRHSIEIIRPKTAGT